MKTILNFFASGFFRKLGQIFAWVLIGFLCLILFNGKIKLPRTIQNILGIDTIKASTNIGSNSGWSASVCQCPTTGTCWGTCSNSTSTGKLPYGTSSQTIADATLYQTNNLIYYTYQSGYSYTISFRTHFGGLGNYINMLKGYTDNWKFWIAGYNNDTTGWSDTYITSSSCSTRFDNTTTNGFITTCSINVNSNLSRVRIETYFWDRTNDSAEMYSNTYGNVSTVRTDFIDISETQGVGANIDNAANNILTANERNSQNIINNQNQNTQDIINSNKVCQTIDSSYIKTPNKKLNSDGIISDSGAYGITDFIKIGDELTYKSPFGNAYFCYYNTVKNLISCSQNSVTPTGKLTPPNNAVYFRATISNEYNSPIFINCSNGNTALYEQGERISGGVHDIENLLEDDDTENDSNDAGDFINDYTIDSETPLSSIILLPINYISQLLDGSSTADMCTTWRNKQICLPNGKIIWGKSFPIIARFKAFFSLVVGGYILYKYLCNLVKTIENALDPFNTKVEVMKL